MISSHYRNPLNYSEEVIENVKKEVAKVENVVRQTSLYLQLQNIEETQIDQDIYENMLVALQDDLNTSLALTQILECVKNLNQLMRQREKDPLAISKMYHTLLKMCDTLGFVFKGVTMDEKTLEIYRSWDEAKKVKDFAKADELRILLQEKGIL